MGKSEFGGAGESTESLWGLGLVVLVKCTTSVSQKLTKHERCMYACGAPVRAMWPSRNGGGAGAGVFRIKTSRPALHQLCCHVMIRGMQKCIDKTSVSLEILGK